MINMPQKRLILINPRGFCAGVDRAIEIVERALKKFGAPIYVRHEIVHNKFVVNGLREKGAIFVEDINEIPKGAIVIFSAHGVSKAVQDKAAARNLRVFDATCPLVHKIHKKVIRSAEQGENVVLIGHNRHPEVEGTKGQYVGYRKGKGDIFVVENEEDVAAIPVGSNEKLSYVTQTTISMDDSLNIVEALNRRFPHISSPRKADVCYATQNRQNAVKKIAQHADLLFVVGSTNSSNSNRLKEIGSGCGIESYLIEDASELNFNFIENANTVAVTAGASAPEVLVEQVVKQFVDWGFAAEELISKMERVEFTLPDELR